VTDRLEIKQCPAPRARDLIFLCSHCRILGGLCDGPPAMERKRVAEVANLIEDRCGIPGECRTMYGGRHGGFNLIRFERKDNCQPLEISGASKE